MTRGTVWSYGALDGFRSSQPTRRVGGQAQKFTAYAKPSTCTVRQFYDGGATNTVTTYKITRWDDGRIEAEFGSVAMPRSQLSEGFRRELDTTCIIVNREHRQVFTAQKAEGRSCRQLTESLSAGHVNAGMVQLCAIPSGDFANDRLVTNGCPSPPINRDRHGNVAPTPTSHKSGGVALCEDWALSDNFEWEHHARRCVDLGNGTAK